MALPLSTIVWKLLIQEPIGVNDIEENDCLFLQNLVGIRDIHKSDVNEHDFHEVGGDCSRTV